MRAVAIATDGRCHVSDELIERMRRECQRHGTHLDVYAEAHRAMDWARRNPKVRSASGVFCNWVKQAIRAQHDNGRKDREQLARDRARMARLRVRLFGILVRRQPTPRQLADELEVVQRSGYPDLADEIRELRRLGDTWPSDGARATEQAG